MTWVDEEVRAILGAELQNNGFPDGVDDLIRLLTRAMTAALDKAVEVVEAMPEVSADPYEVGISTADTVAAIRALGVTDKTDKRG